eukprot:TRINITY_DN12252_c2_g2_i4.p1 TRINITY_DN12252_c2_g2~~TRINITY_DN12252_c2_g2_i4.p1  ORF type:complete len:362 (+),score=63.49 TRINITY_DN12252_c2_g2_i4:190-1275(+)
MRSSLLAARGAFVAAVVLFVLSALNFKRWFLINENSTSLMITVEPTDDGDNIAVMDRAVPAHLERFELQHDTGNRGVLFRMGMGDAERQRLKQLRKEAFEQQQALVFQARMQEVLKQPSPVTEDEYNAAIAVAGLPTNDKCQATHKLQEGCDHGRILPVLVTGVGRSGTHHVENALRLMGIYVCHESACADGAISWPYAVVDPDAFYPWERNRARIHRQKFARVFHQVRHPLRVIASLTTYEAYSWDFINKHTPNIDLTPMHPLRKALIHWVTWNRLVEPQADWRYRMEDTPVLEICRRAGFGDRCKEPPQPPKRADRPHANVSWSQLHQADPFFTREAMLMAQRYGYSDAIMPELEDDVD